MLGVAVLSTQITCEHSNEYVKAPVVIILVFLEYLVVFIFLSLGAMFVSQECIFINKISRSFLKLQHLIHSVIIFKLSATNREMGSQMINNLLLPLIAVCYHYTCNLRGRQTEVE